MSVSNPNKLSLVDDPPEPKEHVTRLHAVVTHYMRDQQIVRLFWHKQDAESFLWSIKLGGRPVTDSVEVLGECVNDEVYEAQVLDEGWDILRGRGVFVDRSFADIVLTGQKGLVQTRPIYRFTRWQRFQNLMKGLGWRLRLLGSREKV